MPKITLPSISEIEKGFAQFKFEEHKVFYWSPRENTIYYEPNEVKNRTGFFQLLHEVSHAILGHKHFTSGIQLLRIETSAWKKARTLAADYNLKIDHNQIQDCLDTYRRWLRQRSICPHCTNIAFEVEENCYRCFNCSQKWSVPSSQQLRNYRLKLDYES